MLKISTLVLLIFTSLSVFAFDIQSQEFSTKRIVRAKLWYEGITTPRQLEEQREKITLAEEVLIPLDLLDS